MTTVTSNPHHTLGLRVYYEDTDAGGVVYHARYLGFAERARTEWVREMMGRKTPMWDLNDPVFMVRHLEMDFRAPAALDDYLTVTTELVSIGGASFDVIQTIRRDAKDIVCIKLTLVSVTREGKVLRLPPEWRQNLSRYLKEGV